MDSLRIPCYKNNLIFNAKTACGCKWQYSDSVTTNPDECKDVE